jgi:hypothetical protein
MLTIFGGIGLLAAVISVVSPQMLPDSRAHIMNELERLYLDNAGGAGIKSGIGDCSLYIDSTTARSNNTLGRQSAAQWIRAAFRKATFLECSQSM